MPGVVNVPENKEMIQSGLVAANNVDINRAGSNALNTTSEDRVDMESVRSRFFWKLIGESYLPFITRRINNESSYYVSVRMFELKVLLRYFNFFHADIYTYTSVRGYFITESEAKLLNEININHSDQTYGQELFQAGNDSIVRMEDAEEFYEFIIFCHNKIMFETALGDNEKCGFIHINSETIVPYCIKDGQKYVPLFYFNGETEHLKNISVQIENWNLAYLKFCFNYQGVRKELFPGDSCLGNTLEDIIPYFPPATIFEDYWPKKSISSQLVKPTVTRALGSHQVRG